MCKYCVAVQNCAYLCNMAVDANYRRRGYGNILLDAADDITKIAGEKDIFLHLRYVANVLLLQHKPVLLHTLCFFLALGSSAWCITQTLPLFTLCMSDYG